MLHELSRQQSHFSQIVSQPVNQILFKQSRFSILQKSLSSFPLRDILNKSKHRQSELLPFPFNASKSILIKSFIIMSQKAWLNYECLMNHKTENKFMFFMNVSLVIDCFLQCLSLDIQEYCISKFFMIPMSRDLQWKSFMLLENPCGLKSLCQRHLKVSTKRTQNQLQNNFKLHLTVYTVHLGTLHCKV